MAAKSCNDPAMPLMMLPGTLCDARLFAPLRARLGPRQTVIGDMYGLSTTAALAERLLERAPERFALLGFSLGAIVALEIAARAPGRVAGLALIGGNAHDVPESEQAERRAALAGIAAVDAHVADTLWPSYVAEPADPALRAMVVAMARAAPADALAVQTELALSRGDSRPRLAAIAGPTLVLAGTDDAINPPAVQRAMAAAIPDARLRLIGHAGHFVPVEQPDACARAVAEWLDEVDAFARAPHSMITSRLKEAS